MASRPLIGIITHHYIKNYGAFLQTLALQETIKALFPQATVEVINFIKTKHYWKNLRPLLLSKPKSRNLFTASKVFLDEKRKLATYREAMTFLNVTKRCRTADEINKRDYDVIIIGSDEVWSTDPLSFDGIKFAFGLNCRTIVSYAPSVGILQPSHEPTALMAAGFKNFKNVSVRDIQTYKLAQRYYRGHIETVLDPTFIYEFEKTHPPLSRLVTSPYILVYQCQLDYEQISLVTQFAKMNGLSVAGAGEHKDWYTDSLVNVSPFEWIALFNNAEFVVTGTFHGVVFSIKARTRFVAFPTRPNRIEKIRAALDSLGLKERFLEKDHKREICNVLAKAVDYQEVDSILEELRKKSVNYIWNCIEGRPR